MKIVQKKYLRTYIALSSMAASFLVGNKVAFAEEEASAVSVPTEATNPTLPLGTAEEPAVSAELLKDEEIVAVAENNLPVKAETILDEGIYGTNQLSGTTEPNAYVVVCAGESKVGEQTADEAGIFRVALASVPEGTTVLQVKVYKDATQTILLSESDWLLPSAEGTEEEAAVDAEDPHAIPSEPSSPVGEKPATDSDPEVEFGTEDSSAEPIGETNPESADAEETAQAPMMTATAAAVEEAKGTWYYYVQSGDTLQKIATHYSTDVASLTRWNSLTSTLINIGQLLSVNGTNAYTEIDKETRTFATKAEFVNYLGKYATEIGNDYNLYASVMIAQASLETAYGTSKLSTVGNNLFGIKGSYDGNSIVMRTWEEESDGSIIWIDAFFRLYPSYYESMIDYAEKLRNGVSWDPNYYKGTWKENTTSYQDATLYLTGRYATDSSYYIKLNAIISAYDLTKFDGPKTVAVNYNAIVSSTNFSIDSLPWGTIGYKYLEPCSNYYGKEVAVTKQTVDGQYALIFCAGKELGWVDMDALKTFSTVPASYTLPIMNSGYSIDSLPWGEPGYVPIADTAAYYGKLATVIRETANGIYAEISVDGVKLGWIDKRAFNASFPSYNAVIRKGNYSIDSLPWGTSGYRTLDWSSSYVGKSVTVIGKSADGAYLCLAYNGSPLGWVDYRAFESFDATAVSYTAIVSGTNFSIDSQPWGEAGYVYLDSSANYYGKEVLVTRKTANGAYAYITLDGKPLGWIDSRGLQNFSTVAVNYSLPIMNGNYSIDSLPWGEPGFVKFSDAAAYFGNLATVLRESANGAYAEIAIDGQRIGWIDKRAFSNARQVSYYAGISGQNYSIDSLPWGTTGYQQLDSTNNYLGSLVKVVAESTDGNYKLVQLNGQNLGWVDYRALAALNTKAVNYVSTIRSVGYSIDSLPWGTPGFTMLGLTSSYLNTSVQVIQESADGYYALVTLNGKTLGWVDKRCF
ncbi:GW dipeptide domain-containing protein [Trichococcus collinsii]|uniref:Peptidoglycan hydrolase n=1 Tax=Trichococcus collinsii TaxID=157076 RepID=A0AB38A151_9LACT|nr:GW dipeptide domain-containing protein [Trichococcus collinsii]CZQ92272.1 lysin motif [Trichococcus collinsii]SEA57453.1 Flagellum-specific peptidoglycan hydrolase FlgJ [Trichococcus collinsii]